MRLRKLAAVSFRNYASLDFIPHPACTILCGQNGQGKTNVLEAVALLATGRSHRQALDRNIAMWDGPGYRLEGWFDADDHTTHTVLVFDGTSKRAECDGVVQEKLSSLIGRVVISLFAPEHLALVKGGPSERRRFFDMNLSQMSPVYLAALQTYTRILRQRNRALQDWSGRSSDWLTHVGVWDAQLIESGSLLQWERAVYVERVATHVQRFNAEIAPREEQLAITYVPSIPTAPSREEIASVFEVELQHLRDRERRYRRTACGPHRDDLRLTINGHALREYGSQGQHRSAVLVLKLAEGAVLHEQSQMRPITLLDDFASELDDRRQAAILENVCTRGQVIITTTELTPALQRVADKTIYRVHGAALEEIAA